jgi:hypothetical protein
VDGQDYSGMLFGRYQALQVYSAVAGLAKDEFTTAQVTALSGADRSDVSRELGRLCRLKVVESTSRRGDYVRVAQAPFWRAVDLLIADAATR